VDIPPGPSLKENHVQSIPVLTADHRPGHRPGRRPRPQPRGLFQRRRLRRVGQRRRPLVRRRDPHRRQPDRGRHGRHQGGRDPPRVA